MRHDAEYSKCWLHARVGEISQELFRRLAAAYAPRARGRDAILKNLQDRPEVRSFISLGRETIPAIICSGDEIDAEIREIDENLMRNELSAMEQGEQLIRRDELLAARGERAMASPGTNQYSEVGEFCSPTKTTASIAADMGISERIAQQRKQIARDIIPEVKDQLRATALAALVHLESTLSITSNIAPSRVSQTSKLLQINNLAISRA